MAISPKEFHDLFSRAQQMRPYEYLYSAHCYIMLILIIVFTIMNLYSTLILPMKMGVEFRPFSIHAAIASFLLIGALNLVQPIALTTRLGGYGVGTANTLGPDAMIFEYWLSWTCIAHLGTLFTFGFLLEFARMNVMSTNVLVRWLQSFDRSGKVWRLLNASFLFHGFLIGVPAVLMRLNLEDLDSIFEARRFLENNPSLYVVAFASDNRAFNFAYSLAGTLIFGEVIFSLVANAMTYRSIRLAREIVNPKTSQMQWTLYKFFSLQLLLSVLFFKFPAILLIVYKMGIVDVSFATPISICIFSWYGPAQFLLNRIQLRAIRRILGTSAPRVMVVSSTAG